MSASPTTQPPAVRYNKLGGRFSPQCFTPKPIWHPPGTPNTWAGSPVGGAPASTSSTLNWESTAGAGSEPPSPNKLPAFQQGKSTPSGRATVTSTTPRAPRVKEAWGANTTGSVVKETERTQRRANSRNKREAIPCGTERVERCTRCTKDEMWLAYDVFRSLDKRKRQSVSRNDFFEALKDFPDMNRLKILGRSRLDHRFRESTQDVDLPEFLKMLWPSATDEDMVKMVRWAQLREAQAVLRDGKFRGEVAELKKIFDLLDENGDGLLTVNELRRARILSAQEIQTLMRTQRLDARMTFHDFCIYAQTHLKAMYVSAATAQQMKEEQSQAHAEDFQSSFRAAFARQG